jgi:hypothetical protein
VVDWVKCEVCGESFKTAQGRAGHLRLATDARHAEAVRAEQAKKAPRRALRAPQAEPGEPPAPQAMKAPTRAVEPAPVKVPKPVRPEPVPRAPAMAAPVKAPEPTRAPERAPLPEAVPRQAPRAAERGAKAPLPAALPAPAQAAKPEPAQASAQATLDAHKPTVAGQARLMDYPAKGPQANLDAYPSRPAPAPSPGGSDAWKAALGLVVGAGTLAALVASLKGAKARKEAEAQTGAYPPAGAAPPVVGAPPPGLNEQDYQDMVGNGWPSGVMSGAPRSRSQLSGGVAPRRGWGL